MPICESCNERGTWRNGDGSFACGWHRDKTTAVYIYKGRRQRLAEWAKNLADEGTVRLKEGTYLHHALVNAFNGRHRFTDLRDNAGNAGSLQKALILGLIEQDKGKYYITEVGREALYQLTQATFYKFVKVAYKKHKAWADHAQNFCW